MAVQFKNNLPRMTSLMNPAVSRLVKKTAFAIGRDWKLDVRVDTGQYRDSIQTEIEAPTKAVIGSPVEHAAYNEFGTSKMEGKPSASTAADKHKKEFQNELANLERSLK